MKTRSLTWLQGCLLLPGFLLLSGCGAGALAGAAAALGGGSGGGAGDSSAAAPVGPGDAQGPSYSPEPMQSLGEIAHADVTQVVDIVLAQDGARAYCSDLHAKEIIEVDVPERRILRRIKLDFAPGLLALHPAGELLYVLDWTAGAKPQVVELELSTEKQKKFTLPDRPTGISVDAARLFVSVGAYTMVIQPLPDGEATTVLDEKFDYMRLTLDRDRQKLYSMSSLSFSLGRFDVAGATPIAETYLHQAAQSTQLSMSADGKALLVHGNLGLREIPSDNFTVKNGDYTLPDTAPTVGIFDPVLPKVWAAAPESSGWKIYEFDRPTFQPWRFLDLLTLAGSPATGPAVLRITPDGSRLVFSFTVPGSPSGGRLLLVDTSAAQPFAPGPTPPPSEALLLAGNIIDMAAAQWKDPATGQIKYRVYAADGWNQRVFAIDPVSETVAKILLFDAQPYRLAASPDGNILAIVLLYTPNAVALIRNEKDQPDLIPIVGFPRDVAFGPSGELYLLTELGKLYAYDSVTLTKSKEIDVGYAERLEVDLVGKKLYVTTGNGVKRFDIPTGLAQDGFLSLGPVNQAYDMQGASVSPDAKSFLVYASEYEFSAETMKPLGAFERPVPENPAYPRLYSEDGAYVYGYTTTPGKELVIYSRAERKVIWIGSIPLLVNEVRAASVLSPLGDKIYLATRFVYPDNNKPSRILAVSLPMLQAKDPLSP